MDRFVTGNRIQLLRSGAEYFPALERAIGSAQAEIWLESYIFADDATGRRIAEALCGAARRGVKVRVLVDGWGAKFYLTSILERTMRKAGVDMKTVSERLGHSSIAITADLHTHAVAGPDADAAERVQDVIRTARG